MRCLNIGSDLRSCLKSGCFVSSPLVNPMCCPCFLWCRHLRAQRYVLPQTLMAFSKWQLSLIPCLYIYMPSIERDVIIIIIAFHFIIKYLQFQEKGSLLSTSWPRFKSTEHQIVICFSLHNVINVLYERKTLFIAYWESLDLRIVWKTHALEK